jgi:IS1 family transposase
MKLKIMLDIMTCMYYIIVMNKLSLDKRIRVLNMLCEGSSMRSISRVVEISINTVTKLLVDAGKACAAYHDEHVRNLHCRRIQCDEIWAFCYAKQKNVLTAKKTVCGAGDIWNWTSIDADSKLICNWIVGNRDARYAITLMNDLRGRLANRVQLTTDGHKAYLEAVENAFGGDIDYAMLVKLYGDAPESAKGKYSPAECNGCHKKAIQGNPNKNYVSTSYAERQNLTMRMSIRRFTRLTNAFSKKIENHEHALALYFVYYNFVRIHKALRVSPAMAAGITDKLLEMTDIVKITDDYLKKNNSN